MSQQPPLLSLLTANLQDASTLGLLDDSTGAVAAFAQELRLNWVDAPEPRLQRQQFQLAMRQAASRLGGLHVPMGSHSRRYRAVATVLPLSTFASYYERPISNGASRELRDLVSNAGSAEQRTLADEACVRFSATYGDGRPGGRGVQVSVRELGIHTRNTWTAPGGTHAQMAASRGWDAQRWSARLGLDGAPPPPEPAVGHALVRVVFGCEPMPVPAGRLNWQAHVRNHPAGIWLIRPSMIHEGNRRFVQRHEGDGPPPAARRYGKTRDLGTPGFLPGEREALLLAGEEAKIRFLSVQCLPGWASGSATHDLSDDAFVRAVMSTAASGRAG